MSRKENEDTAQRFLAALRQGAAPDDIATLFSNDVEFEIPGDAGALPWLGQKKKGRGAVVDFVRGLRELTEPVKFDVQDVVTSENRAVIVGELATRLKATGKIIESPFAIILTISSGAVSHFQMLEDSFAVAEAGKP